MTTKRQISLLDLIRKHPGLDALTLRAKGWSPKQGSLAAAEAAGLIEYRNGGWYVKEAKS